MDIIYFIVIDKFEKPRIYNIAFGSKALAQSQVKSFPHSIQYRCTIESASLHVQKPFAERWEAHKQHRISEIKSRALKTNVQKRVKELEQEYAERFRARELDPEGVSVPPEGG